MKILFTLFDIEDWGGICADLVYKLKGLQEAGHTVDFCYLSDADRPTKKRGHTKIVGAYDGPIDGMQVHTRYGFYGVDVVCYGSEERMKAWYEYASKYDFVIHEIPGPIPTKAESLDSHGYWYRLYQHDTRQIISAHDANFRDQYPHIIYFADKIRGISCTNQAGYAGLSQYPGARAFVGAPHPVYKWDKLPRWKERKKQAVSAHVWKMWKHMEFAVGCAKHLKTSKLMAAGDGIIRAYMQAKPNGKPDRDAHVNRYAGLWDGAVGSGNMDYLGMLTPKELNSLYRESRVMLDTSWSTRFEQLGCHFNRSIIEGYNNGCVPICVKENMDESGFQLQMFKRGKTHFEISKNDSPKQLAELVDHVANLKEDEAMEIVERGRKILKRFFDYRVSSLAYIELAKGKPAGVYPELDYGQVTSETVTNAELLVKKIDTFHRKAGREVSHPKELDAKMAKMSKKFAKKSLF
jgi:hypothetical protein